MDEATHKRGIVTECLRMFRETTIQWAPGAAGAQS